MKKIFLLAVFIISGIFLSCSRDEPFVAPVTPPPVVTVKINEIYSRGTVGNEDWIEIYNPSNAAIDIGGYKIYDSGGQSGSKPKKEIPLGTSISANSFFVITVDDTTSSGFGLSSNGEEVWLEDATGNLIDDITFPALGVDTSYGRNPNGSDNWQKLSPPTKGISNGSGGVATLPLVMNEIYSRGTVDDPDWIEIYNPNSVQVDLTGYKIYDSGGQSGSKPKMEFPSGTIIAANSFFVIITADGSAADFGLSSGGEEVWLENSSGTVIDDVTFLAMDVTQSYGRYPDGSANLQLLSVITKGAPNQQ
jgi:predicted extracellular nuclease